MEIRKIRLTQIEANTGQIEGLPANPRKWTDIEMDRLKESILQTPELFEARGLIVYPLEPDRYIVLGGNMRYAAARKLALRQVPCIILPPDTTPEKMREIAIKDNGSFGQWDTDMLASDWNIDDLGDWGVDIPDDWKKVSGKDKCSMEAVEDDYQEPEKLKSKVKRGEIWQLGEHRLMCGDSTSREDVERLMQGEKADMVFTDPPYNINYGNIKHQKCKVREIENDNMDKASFVKFCQSFIVNIKEFCKGCVYMCAGQGEDGRLMFVEADKLLHNSTTIIWNKDQFTLGRGKYQNKYEPIWFGWVESGIDFTDNRTLTNVWDIKRPKKSELHPTMKPIELISTALSHNPGSKSVLDVFGGSGSTLIACEQLKRKCYMMELTEHYCDVIINRWEKLTGLKAEKISSIV